jgi:cation:H+ antiporter
VQKQSVWKEIPYSFLAALLFFFLLNDQILWGKPNFFSRLDSFILTFCFLAFLFYVFKTLKKENVIEHKLTKKYKLYLVLLMIAGGLAGLVIGGRMVVNNAISIARVFDLSENIIGLTIIAAGTSLPELATSAVAAYRKSSDIAIGNIIGSNIFNILFIMSVSGLITPMPYDDTLNLDLIVLMMGTILLFLNMFSGKIRILDRWEAALLLLGYLGYVYFLIMRE